MMPLAFFPFERPGCSRVRILMTPLTVLTVHRAVLSKNKIRTDYIPGSGGVRDIMSLRGDNDGLQRNRWPDRAHVRRGTYDLRRNSHPLSTSPIHADVAFLSVLTLNVTVVRRYACVVTILQFVTQITQTRVRECTHTVYTHTPQHI